ncbi:RidA family protein [Sphingomonas gilva]|uniref:RidA family protein n=1 Tax=Sphingomonas gilva TaxID=2305907 RepID=A0A396RLY3_9SPHN|nr:RidA family protein [Sphingomonas gilva]RHW17348.1 RidA family protein [Sphingomonas gilva]
MSAKPPLSPARVVGNLVFTSGQLARGADGAIVAGGIEAQAKQVMANLAEVLADNGCTPADVVKVTAWLTDASYGAAFNAAYREVFGEPYPARSTVVSGLLAPDALIEVEAIALKP